jgi:hypothetical protein
MQLLRIPGRLVPAVLASAFVLPAVAISVPDYTVQVSATVQANPPRIALSWPADPDATGYTLYRKAREAAAWGAGTTLATNATGYVDSNILVGQTYEYRISKSALEGSTSYSGAGYIYAGVEAPLIDFRGQVLLLVDRSQTNALAAELARLQLDLAGDGWTVRRYDVPRQAIAAGDTSTNNWDARSNELAAVRNLILTNYNADPSGVKAVFLFGHVPVPYSGSIAPDGHGDHVGAWGADGFYGDVNGAWTDSTLTSTNAGRAENRNLPGDGKFDQSSIPSDLELEVGRVDLWNLPAFARSETELLRQYLNKDHQFRFKRLNFPRRGLVDDHFGTFSGEAFALNGYRSFAPMFGAGNVLARPWFTELATNGYLCGYACGGGSYTSEGGVGTTASFALTNTQVIFTMHFGSYFGDFDSPNNFMRAQLANEAGGLSCAWAGRPHWVFHHMALGETLGFSARVSQNNSSLYAANFSTRGIHLALLGDPTLRLHVVAPPSALIVATHPGGDRELSWLPSPDGVLGYHIYSAPSAAGPFTRLTDSLVPGTSYADTAATNDLYMVRAVKLETSGSGTYYNSSQGIFQDLSGTFAIPAIAIKTPTNGAIFPVGQPIVVTPETSDPNEDVVRVDFYADGLHLGTSVQWPFPFTWTNAALGPHALTAVATDAGGLSATSAVVNMAVTYASTKLLPAGSVWKYYDLGDDLGTAWRAPDFDDRGWPSGPAQLGFGDGDEATRVNSNSNRITTYFRTGFTVPESGTYLAATVRLLRDDGAVGYLNGTEVFRSNMPTTPTIGFSTWASAAVGGNDETVNFYSYPINLALLPPGNHVLAVEIHQYNTNSSDLSFDLELLATNLPPSMNTPPVMSALANLTTDEDVLSAPAAFTVGDAQTRAQGLAITASSSDTNLVPAANVFVGGSGSNRFLTILPGTNRHGTAFVTLTVSDGLAETNASFLVTVNPVADPPAVTLTNPTNGAVLAVGPLMITANVSDPETNLALVEFLLDGTKLGQRTTAPFAFPVSSAPFGFHLITVRATDSTGLSATSAPAFVTLSGAPQTLVSRGATWRYWDSTNFPGAAWATPGFDDHAWSNGVARLGYGGDGEVTQVTSNQLRVTTYFRRTFSLADPATIAQLTARLQRDDGAVVYLNGAEVWRSNMTNSGPITPSLLSTGTVSGAEEQAWFTNVFGAGLLGSGTNIIAVEVHQVSLASSDLAFDFELLGSPAITPPPVTAKLIGGQLRLSWPAWAAGLSLWTTTDLDSPSRWTPVAQVPVVDGDEVVLTLDANAPQQFFRLAAP